ncbi:MAG: hydrogen gas-evolving membrane-bound hydrogenase subunit E [Candidatus Margulisiibacteriota bacterium]|nr:hydrogen gas-evolving membrane-bound hydrogenase subunit E [Candidatus Margulisiibacteriota bacterium]
MNRIVAVIVLLILAFFLFSAVRLDYGHPRQGLSEYFIAYGVAQTGALNTVTSIYLNYRVYDTLGEATVFFAAALGVFMLLRKEGEEK